MDNIRSLVERKFLPYVNNPVRYTGAELNMVKKELEKVSLHGVLCFPDLYDIGMSHFGLQILYHIVNREPGWALSRCFHPWIDAEKIMRENNIPLYSLEYFTPVKDADWVGFSVQYELQYTNIVNMLSLSGISVLSKDRGETEPIVIAGGPCVGNPEPLALFVDAFALGDGEETIVSICKVIELGKKTGNSRQQRLEALSRIPGVYVPSFHKFEKKESFVIPCTGQMVVTAAKIPVLRKENYPEKPIVPLMEVIHSRLAVEVMRGCTRGCRFCSAGYYYRPVRERKPEQIHDQIRCGIGATGLREVGLLSLSTADYSCLSGLLNSARELKDRFHLSLGLPSTRIDALSDEQLDLFENVTSTSSLTIAPEAGSARLRRVINKDFTDDEIYNTVKRLLERNIQTLKLYFMIGLPTETQDDIEAIVKMVSIISGMVRAKSSRRMVHVAISPFSPKPHTPFCREKMESVGVLLEKSIYVKKSLRSFKNVKVSYRNPDITLLESIMARGDRQIGQVIYLAWQKGARFDGWDECFLIERWYEASRELSVDLSIYLNEISEEAVLPWSSVSTGVTDEFLVEEKRRALQEQSTPDCRHNDCAQCGVCHDTITTNLQSDSTELLDKNDVVLQKEKDSSNLIASHYYRLFYSKGDALRFLGHLDLVKLFHRAFLIAGIPIAYSNGFSPHPRISFGPPLPLGVTGEREAFDIGTVGPFSYDYKQLNAWLPHDLKILEQIDLPMGEMSLNASIQAAGYLFLSQSIDILLLKQRIEKFLSTDIVELEIEKKGLKRIKNIRQGIIEITQNGDGKGFYAILSLIPGASCKPLELVSCLYPEIPFSDFFIIRKKCIMD